jgi:type I restriction enzyme S subunit
MSFKLTVGKVSVLDIDAFHNEAIISIYPRSGISQDYLFWFLPVFAGLGTTKDAIKGATLNSQSLSVLPVPVPPTAEQHRIVAKVDALMAQADALAERLAAEGERRRRYHTAALARLTDNRRQTTDDAISPSPLPPFSPAPLLPLFDRLYADPAAVAELKQAILQLAVMGRLVPQDPTDEPAEVLLERIDKERKVFLSNINLKRTDALKINANEAPYNVPPGWAWARIEQVCTVRGGKRLPNGFQLLRTETPYVYIRVTDMREQTIVDRNLRYIPKNIYDLLHKYIIEKGDIYLVIVGATIGKHGIVPERFKNMILTENAVRMTPHIVSQQYIDLAIGSATVQEQFFGKTIQMAQPKLAIKRINTTAIPIPPLAEQHRIVAKVDELFALADAAASRGAAAEAARERWVERITN